jgi:hypothetical protein
VGALKRATAAIEPVKAYHYDTELRCDVRTVVGYRVECDCGWRSQSHRTVAAARLALTNHRSEHLSPNGETGA